MKNNILFLLLMSLLVSPLQALVHNDDIKNSLDYNSNTIISKQNGIFYITIDTYYRMGDSDSRASSIEVALQMARLESSSASGTYIQSNLQIKNGKITLDDVKILTASVISIKINKEKLLIDNNQMLLHLNTTAKVNEKSLDKNINAFKKSESKKKQLISLSQKNKKLIKEVKTLSNKLGKKVEMDFAAIAKKRKRLLDKINANTKSMKMVFKKGTLFEMANKFDKELEYHRGIALVDYKQNILENTKVTTKVLKVMPNQRNSKLRDVIVEINIGYPKSALDTLSKYYEYSRRQDREYNWVNNVINSEKGWKTPYSENLAKTFLGEDLHVKICLGKYCIKNIVIKSRGQAYANIFNIINRPIKFKKIPKNTLNTISEITSKIFWKKRKSEGFQDDWED